MISCIEWVPKGVADPSPKRYELSAAEAEILQQQAELEVREESLDKTTVEEDGTGNEEAEEDQQQQDEQETKNASSIASKLPKIDPSSLPADLRMDEYSDDEDADAVRGSALGQLLVGKDNEMIGTRLDANGMPVNDIDEEDDDDGEEDENTKGKDGMEKGKQTKKKNDDDSDEDSDDDDDDIGLDDIADTREYMPVDVEGLEAMNIGGSGGLYADHLMNDDDQAEPDENDSEADDTKLQPDDAIVVVAKTEEDFAALEVHVYEEKTGNLFVHHDIPLPSFPLCLAHGDIGKDGTAGNFCAVGTFSPGIEVWNLDVLNALEPSCVLGGEDTTAADELMKINMARAMGGKKLHKKKALSASSGLVAGSHTDAVMSLSWNKTHRQVIASGSADKTVKLWDITTGANAATLEHHRDKVQAIEWHPTEGTLLATGSYDRTVAVVDARSTEARKVKISADIEALVWDPHHSHYLTAAMEDGVLSSWDVRKFEKPVWSFVADEFGGVSDLSYSPLVPGLLVTCAINKTVTLWDTYKDGTVSETQPTPCGSKDMSVGKLYTVSMYPSSPWILACGGGGKEIALWDMTRESSVRNRFSGRVSESGGTTTTTPSNQEESETKETDFEAMMAVQDGAMEKIRENEQKKTNNKKGKKSGKKGKKKGAHRRGR